MRMYECAQIPVGTRGSSDPSMSRCLRGSPTLTRATPYVSDRSVSSRRM